MLPLDNWVCWGDFNVVEKPEDMTGPSLIRGRELNCWRALKMQFELVDVLLTQLQYEGSGYTWRRSWRQELVQSQLDHFYVMKGGWCLGTEIS